VLFRQVSRRRPFMPDACQEALLPRVLRDSVSSAGWTIRTGDQLRVYDSHSKRVATRAAARSATLLVSYLHPHWTGWLGMQYRI
jgi:hypothetical protein